MSPTLTVFLVASSVEAPRSNHRRLSYTIPPSPICQHHRECLSCPQSWEKIILLFVVMPYFIVFHPDFIEFHEIRKPWWLFKKVMFLKFQAQKTQWLVGKRWETYVKRKNWGQRRRGGVCNSNFQKTSTVVLAVGPGLFSIWLRDCSSVELRNKAFLKWYVLLRQKCSNMT